MADPSDSSAARRAGIVKATSGEFLRYGFKKTSMDDLARAAGLSRQGLYLHFATKEALFKQTVLRVVETARAACRAALAREELDVEERLLGAFDAVHGNAIGEASAEQMNELLETAAQLVGPVVDELEQGFVADITRVLRSEGVAAKWKNAGISAKELAEQLFTTSLGLRQRATTRAEYRERMRTAVRMVCRGATR